MGTLRVALIGCGRHGTERLAPAIRANDGLALTAFVDLNPEAAHRAAGGHGEIFPDVATLGAADVAAAAVIAVPHDALAETTLACIEAGLHVLVEKPVARDRGEAEPVVAAARQHGVVYMPAYCLRFNAVRTRLHSMLWRGVIGETTSLVAAKGGRPLTGWLADPQRGGGELAFLGSHLVDQVLWLHHHRVQRVFAHGVEREDSGSDETSAVVLVFEDGVPATLLISQASGVGFDYVEVTGRAGRVRSDWKANLLTVDSTVSRELDLPSTLQLRSDPVQPMYDAELAEFADAIRTDRQPSVTGLDALRVLAVLDAIRESVATGQAVAVDDPWDGRTPHPSAPLGPARLRVQFTYPADKIQSPFVYELSRRFHLKFDIRRADVDAGIGWVQVLLEGERGEIDAAIKWAESRGVRAAPVEGDVVGG